MVKYIVYKTTNTETNKIYIGVHKQYGNDFDGYFGSNTDLKRDIKSLGVGKFLRETLYSFSEEMDAYNKESYLVDKTFISRSDTYNKQVGGKGGFHGCNTPEATKKSLEAVKKLMAKRYNGDVAGQLHTKEVYDKVRSTRKEKSIIKSPVLKRKVSVYNTLNLEVWKGYLVDLLIKLFGSEQGVSRRFRVVPKLDEGKYTIDKRTDKNWGGYTVKFND